MIPFHRSRTRETGCCRPWTPSLTRRWRSRPEPIRVPTVNPPGDVYDECARFIGRRLASLGFEVEYVDAQGRAGALDAAIPA